MEKPKPMIIVGGPKSGKSTRAREEAARIGGRCVVAYPEDLQSRFGLGRVLGSSPDVVVVEGLELKGRAEWVKQLVSGDDIEIEEQCREPRFVPAPFFIFTMLTPPHWVPCESSFSRFQYIILED